MKDNEGNERRTKTSLLRLVQLITKSFTSLSSDVVKWLK